MVPPVRWMFLGDTADIVHFSPRAGHLSFTVWVMDESKCGLNILDPLLGDEETRSTWAGLSPPGITLLAGENLDSLT
ncbi:hypothetical protein NPIL_558461 [Nephila pilipes]|uniref:Uncharacterized protein n=1 Tax=Nephila pilipes TaxID=299642 RepID=A0A8X6PE49_NEPPI|nr:hypothetical protein NPIL_558461 [Nephila pilipes]